MDLARSILLELEKCAYTHGWHDIKIEGHSDQEITYHVQLLYQAGLIDAIDLSTMGTAYPDWRAKTITWDGHEFLDSSRDLTRWEKAKAMIVEQGKPITLEALKLTFSALIRLGFPGA